MIPLRQGFPEHLRDEAIRLYKGKESPPSGAAKWQKLAIPNRRCAASVEELKKEAFGLSPESRAHLARELLASLDALSEPEIERLWIDEAIRRDQELDSGAAQAYPADEALARARARRK